MNASVSLLSAIWSGNGFPNLAFLGFNQAPVQHAITPTGEGSFLNTIPPGYESVSVSFIRDNLAVIPGEWEAGGISKFVSASMQTLS